MIKTILASLTGYSSDRTVLDAAAAAARLDGAHIHCLHTRIDPAETAAMYKSLASGHGDTLQRISREIAGEEQIRSSHAKTEFQDACSRHKLAVRQSPGESEDASISWTETVTFFNETLHESRFHDLVVMGRDAELSSERIKSVLMRAGRPILLAPPKPVSAIGRKLAIAWKAGPEAARALTAANAFLSHAEQVAILCVSDRPESDGRDRESAELLAKHMRWRGLGAELQMSYEISGSTSEKLREMAYNCDADLLVMGAYGHSRVQEFVFGGVTNGMLSDCALPLLMFH